MKNRSDLLLVDLDYYISDNQVPVLRLFTKDLKGKTVILHINNFFPYFYVEQFDEINHFIRNNSDLEKWITVTSKITKKIYQGGREIEVIKIMGKIPFKVPEISNIFKDSNIRIFEADIPFVNRFLIDTGTKCLQPVKIDIIKDESFEYMDQYSKIAISYKNIFPMTSEASNNDYNLKYLAFDIEVAADQETVQQLISEAEKRIIAISICYGNLKEHYKTEAEILAEYSDSAERNLVSWFLEKVATINPDVLITYNGDLFDIPYLQKRMSTLNLSTSRFSVTQLPSDDLFYHKGIKSFRIKGRICVDLFYKTWGLHPTSGKKTLNDIAEMKMNISKEERPDNFQEIWKKAIEEKNTDAYENLLKYSIRDAELTYLLFEPLGQLDQVDAVRLVGMPLSDGIATTARNIGEFELFRVCYNNNTLIPMLPTKDELQKRQEAKRRDPHKGGLVLEPKEAFYESVGIFDFRSMYPSIISAFNIGGESYYPPQNLAKIPSEELFLQSPRTSLAIMMDNVLEERIKYKKLFQSHKNSRKDSEIVQTYSRRSTTLKLVLNSTYGSHNYPRGRFFSKEISDAITDIGRSYINWLERAVKEFNPNFEIIYGDTDSAFVWFKNNSIPDIKSAYESKNQSHFKSSLEKIKEFVDHINSLLKKPMELELEEIVYRIAFKKGRRKAYAFVNISGKLFIKGFEAVRGDWSLLAREAQRTVLFTLLSLPTGGEKEAKKSLMNFVEKLRTLPPKELVKQVVIYSPIKRSPSKYKTKIPVIGAFIHYCKQKRLDPEKFWKEFDKFPWIIIPGKGNLSSRARHPDYANKIDRFHYIDEIVRAATRFGVNLSLTKKSGSQNTLEHFLNNISFENISRRTSGGKKITKNKKSQGYLEKYLEPKKMD